MATKIKAAMCCTPNKSRKASGRLALSTMQSLGRIRCIKGFSIYYTIKSYLPYFYHTFLWSQQKLFQSEETKRL